MGRATQGVTLIALDAGEKLAGLEKVIETEDDSDLPELAAADDVDGHDDGQAGESSLEDPTAGPQEE
ncbi:MAG: hypothetical protein AW12_03072 [Candidatus Accumulibacter sp. BA-94]|nr:MAG: hypothetical protein AW12_03072 [Candidatus Accumulibacter sp. BA-94]